MAVDERMVDQLRRSIENLTRRIERLEEHKRFDSGKDWMPANWWGRCSPTQPASKIVQVSGGKLWTVDPGVSGYPRILSTTVYDFSTIAAFAGSQFYRWVVLQANVIVSPVSLRVYEGPEFGTSGEAESDFYVNGVNDNLYDAYMPLAVLVLRNDGDLGVVGAIENITLADRTQSYFLEKDFRPWLHVHESNP